MAALAGLTAHGGLAGAVVESLVILMVVAILIAIWLRERRSGDEDRSARLRDDEQEP